MPRKKPTGVFVELPNSLLHDLNEALEGDVGEGLAVADANADETLRKRRDDFCRRQLTRMIIELAEERTRQRQRDAARRPAGRPSVHRPRLPEDIETSNNASGYTGVFVYGKSFKAFWDKHEANGFLGVWDNAEDAAFARYWFMKGRNTLATEMLGRGSPDPYATQREFHMHMRGLEPKRPYAIGDVVDYDPVYTQGPIRRQVRIVEGPFPLEDEMVGWKLFGVNGIVPSIDFERSKG